MNETNHKLEGIKMRFPKDQLGENEGNNKLEGIKLRFAMDKRFPPLQNIDTPTRENLTMVL
ncbi:Hypothetical protein FKW44_010594 [Caligus rogercresseyi]|uniref:Uncharacterized protein n=1 Tax=Caligus rogercresseyi TaxID=217165 RepID=A0A7T8HH78_CALRO|nr:Hypothetical protein FKW44_010594 [Caligus rogercresseyi]